MAVRLTSPQRVIEGHTVDISAIGTFVSCVPPFRIGEEVVVEIILAQGRVAELSLRAVVTRRVEHRSEDDPAVGLGLTWSSAICRSSPLPLQHFLEHILHITAPQVEATGSELYWYRFKQSVPEAPQPDSRSMRPTSSLSRLRGAFGRPVRVPVHADSAAPAGQSSAPPAPRRQVERKVRVATAQHAVRRENESTRTQPMAWGSGGPATLNRAPAPAPQATPATSAAAASAAANAAPQHRPPAPQPAPAPAAPTEERRRRPRVEVSTPVTYFIGSESHLGRSVDVSRAGVYVETDGPLPKLGDRTNIRLPVLHAGRHHVVMLTTRIARYKGAAEKPGKRRGFAADYQVVDELGVPGIFSHFLRTRMDSD
ncbi:MAG: PilZ domain-containing protein [Myxococcota bacterium]